MNFIKHLILFLTIASLTNTVSAKQPDGSEYLAGNNSDVALILAHGRGKGPTWKVVEPLRKGVNDALGYHTLSLQMPNRDIYWEDYAEDFPQAYAAFIEGIRFLSKEKGVKKIFIMGHSMGSRMASAFIANNKDQPIAGLIVAGCRNNGNVPLSCLENLKNVTIPVLDIWGDGSGKDANAGFERDGLASSTYKQIELPDANHKFNGHEPAFVSAVVEWLKTQ